METPHGEHEIAALGCLIASGADAGSFLQAQLSADLAGLEAGQLAIGGWHNPNGRVRCLLWTGPNDSETWRIVTQTDQLESLVTGLNRYVLRANVSFAQEPDAVVKLATNASGISLPGTSYWPLPGPDNVGLYAGPGAILAATDQIPVGIPASSRLVSAGVPQLEASLADQFLGPSLNLDLVGGISFTKGCFPGQEVLARTHNLGKVKRRLLKFTTDGAAPQPGQGILNASGDLCGQVVSSNDTGELLASMQLRLLNQALFLSDSEAALQSAPLPYAIPELEDAS